MTSDLNRVRDFVRVFKINHFSQRLCHERSGGRHDLVVDDFNGTGLDKLVVESNDGTVDAEGEHTEVDIVFASSRVRYSGSVRATLAGCVQFSVFVEADQLNFPVVSAHVVGRAIGKSALHGQLYIASNLGFFVRPGLNSGGTRHAAGICDREGRGIADAGVDSLIRSVCIPHLDYDIVRADHSWVEVSRVETIGRVNSSGGVLLHATDRKVVACQ